MNDELKSPSPDPDWNVLETAKRMAQDTRWLIAHGLITEQQAAPVLAKLADIIQAEIDLLA